MVPVLELDVSVKHSSLENKVVSLAGINVGKILVITVNLLLQIASFPQESDTEYRSLMPDTQLPTRDVSLPK